MDPKKYKISSPRIKIIQKLYNALMNPKTVIEYPKNQYKKFIKDVVTGTLERSELIEETMRNRLNCEGITDEREIEVFEKKFMLN